MELIYEINKRKYVMFSVLILSEKQSEKILKNIDKHEGIIQSYDIKEPNSFWDRKKLKMEVLIPEENAINFSKNN